MLRPECQLLVARTRYHCVKRATPSHALALPCPSSHHINGESAHRSAIAAPKYAALHWPIYTAGACEVCGLAVGGLAYLADHNRMLCGACFASVAMPASDQVDEGGSRP